MVRDIDLRFVGGSESGHALSELWRVIVKILFIAAAARRIHATGFFEPARVPAPVAVT
jgi:hypothetical protein